MAFSIFLGLQETIKAFRISPDITYIQFVHKELEKLATEENLFFDVFIQRHSFLQSCSNS